MKQQEIENAFRWARQTYREAAALMGDAVGVFDADGWQKLNTTTDHGYYSTINSKTAEYNMCFVYLACHFFVPKAEITTPGGDVCFVAIDFHDVYRSRGPILLGGRIHCREGKGALHQNAVNGTARVPGLGGFGQASEGVVTVHRPQSPDQKLPSAGALVDAVEHVEVPLTSIQSHTDVEAFVKGLIAMRGGDRGPITEFVEGHSADATNT